MAEIKTRKVALIGAGAVGTSFLYAAMNRGIADEYGIIDINIDGALGNKLDLEDANPTNLIPYKISIYEYKDLKSIDIIIITAGRPQKPNETRIQMVADNAKIMSFISKKVKESGFTGITIIASNPVDVMTQVYQEVTNFPPQKVIGSGTSLDSARLQEEISQKIQVAPQSISAYVMGEHGDSSVSVFSSAMIGAKPLMDYVKSGKIKKEQLEQMHKNVWKKAYTIINKKKSTFYGIGSSLANLTKAIIRNTKEIYAVGAKLNGQYGYKNLYIGVPAVIGSKGIIDIPEIPMNSYEKKQFDKSANILKNTIKIAKENI